MTAGDANAGGSGATVYDPHNGAHTLKGATREGKAPALALAPPGDDAVVPPSKPEGPARDTTQYETGAFAAGLPNPGKHAAGLMTTNDRLTSGARGNDDKVFDGFDQAVDPSWLSFALRR